MNQLTAEDWDRIAREDRIDKTARSICIRRLHPDASPFTNIYAPWVEPTPEDRAEARRQVDSLGVYGNIPIAATPSNSAFGNLATMMFGRPYP